MKRFLLIFGFLALLVASPAFAEGDLTPSLLPEDKQELQWAQNQVPQVFPHLGRSDTDSSESLKMPDFEQRFAQKNTHWGLDIGYGYTFNLPPVDAIGDRTNVDFLYIFPKWKYNLTGIKGNGPWRGALYWVIDGGLAIAIKDPTLNSNTVGEAPLYTLGFSPLQLEYKFLSPARKWAPFVFAGAGISIGDWHEAARELDTALEFILNTGGGLEYFLDNGTSINFAYRLWHLSNSNIKGSNIGLNAHLFTVGFMF